MAESNPNLLFRYLVLCLTIFVLLSPFAGIVVGESSTSTQEWNQFQGSASHTGYSDSPGPVNPVKIWSQSIGGTLDGLIASNGILVVSVPDNGYAQPSITEASPPNSGLTGLSESSGSVLYQYSTKPPNYCPSGATVEQSTYPAIWGSSIYLEVDQASNTNCGLGLNQPQWMPALGMDHLDNAPGYFASVYGAASVATNPPYGWGLISTFQGYVAFAGFGDTHLTLFNAETGSQVWTFNAPGDISTIPTSGDNEILLGYENVAVATLISLTGRSMFNVTLSSPMSGTPSFSNGIFYFGTGDGSVCALNAQGTITWCKNVGSTGESTPSVAGSNIFFGADDGHVYDLSGLDGNIQWSAYVGGSVKSSAAVSSNGIVYDTSTTGALIALNETSGSVIWEKNLGVPFISSPMLDNGALFVVDSVGTVYGFQDRASLAMGSLGITLALSSQILLSLALPAGLASVFVVAGKMTERKKGP